MAVNLKGRSFLTLMDFSPEEIRYLLDLAENLKEKKRSGAS
ncbi:MAG TPA: ornithine carbamoyltransferase, partial [Bacteroidales bacterium]|nr:ornithine carbamoyltransferase [Bacteroidales bacterium]